MRKRTGNAGAILAGLAMVVAVGCASTQPMEVTEAQRQLEQKERDLAAAQAELRDRDSQIQALSSELEQQASLPAVSSPPPRQSQGAVTQGLELLPPSAKAGECYARAFVPPEYTTRELRKLKRAASERVEVVPATYETVSERVLVKEASQRLETVAPVYGEVEEQVLVREASFRLEEVPATYVWQEEQVLVRPAETVWKKGRGPIERVDDATGEIMCLVEVPARFKTVRTRVLETAATTRRVEIPAEYKTVKRRVVQQTATTRTIELPAEYRSLKVRKLVTPARESRFEIPAEYQTLAQREMVSEGRMAWRPVLCETNASRSTISSIQRALQGAGHNPGPIDGVVGQQTLAALKSYQTEKQLPTGGMTYATIESLGVEVGR